MDTIPWAVSSSLRLTRFVWLLADEALASVDSVAVSLDGDFSDDVGLLLLALCDSERTERAALEIVNIASIIISNSPSVLERPVRRLSSTERLRRDDFDDDIDADDNKAADDDVFAASEAATTERSVLLLSQLFTVGLRRDRSADEPFSWAVFSGVSVARLAIVTTVSTDLFNEPLRFGSLVCC